MQTADQLLLERWRAEGDAAAFREITARYAGLVYAAAKRVLKDASDAEDVAQECFEALALRRDAAPTYLGAWLHTVATNRALNFLDSAQRRRAREQRAAAATPEYTRSEWDDLYEHVDAVIAELPDEFRAAIVGHFLDGQSKADLARALGVSRPAIHYRIDKGLEQVRHALRRKGVTASAGAFGAAMAAQVNSVAPTSLIAGLGKLAVSGALAINVTPTPVLATTLIGSIVMKKALVAGVVAATIVAGSVTFIFNQNPGPPSRPSTSAHHVDNSDNANAKVVTPPDGAMAIAVDTVAPETPPEARSATAISASVPKVWPDMKNAGLGDLAIAGRVVDAHDRPIGDVFIQLFGKQGSLADVHSREDGSFRMTGLPPGNYRVHVFPIKGYSDQDLNLEAGDENVLIMMQANAKVAGRVVDARTGSPVARFKISSQDGIAGKIEPGLVRERLVVEDPRGHFEIGSVELGESTLIVEADGYATEFTPLRLESSDPVRDIKIAVQPGVAVEGRVTDAAGNPVVGAWVFAETPPPVADLKRASLEPEARIEEVLSGVIAGTSGKNGAFAVHTLRGDEVTLFAFHPGHGSGQAPLAWSGTSPLRGVNIILENSVGSAEIFVTLDGKPAEGVEVFASPVGGHGTVFQRGATGADGRATLTDLPAGFLGITAVYPGQKQHARRITTDTDIETGKLAHVNIEFVSATATLEGVVRLGEQPAIGGFVMLQLPGADRAESYREDINPDGTFRFERVSAGEASLQIGATFGEFPRIRTMPVTLVEGELQQLDIDMKGGGSIQGLVTGVPAATHGLVIAMPGEQVTQEDVTMAFLPLIGEFAVGTCVIGGGGVYAIDGLLSGEYTLLVLVTKTSGGPDFFNDAIFVTAAVEVVDGETAISDFSISK